MYDNTHKIHSLHTRATQTVGFLFYDSERVPTKGKRVFWFYNDKAGVEA